MALFESLFRSRDKERFVELTPGKPFPWRAGVRLSAIERVHVMLPGAVWRQGTELGKIIEGSSPEITIGFDNGPDGVPKIIHVILAPGQSVTLHAGSEVMLGKEHTHTVRLKILEGTESGA